MASTAERHFERIAVTGGSGFIGRRVTRLLDEAGAPDVTVLGGPSPSPHETGGHAVDLRDADATRDVLAGHDAIVHLASRSGGIGFQGRSHDEVLRDNVLMTSNVLEAAVEGGADTVLLASSAVVYEGAGHFSERDAVVEPGSPNLSGYAWSKVSNEVQTRWRGDDLNVLICRLTNVYGPGATFDESSSTVVHALVRRAMESTDGRLTVWGDGRAVRDFIHVEDAAAAIVAVLLRGSPGETYNIATREETDIRRLAEMVRDATNPALDLEFLPDKPTGPEVRTLDVGALESLGFEPKVRLREGIAQVVEAWRSFDAG